MTDKKYKVKTPFLSQMLPSVYFVAAEATPNLSFAVVLNQNGEGDCTCKTFMRRHTCAHIPAARAFQVQEGA